MNFKGLTTPPASTTTSRRNAPATREVLFRVEGCTATWRSAASLQRGADGVEDARSTGQTLALRTAVSERSLVKWHSLFFAPSSAMRLAYPQFKHLWRIEPAAAPFNTMHLLTEDVAPTLWKLFSGILPINVTVDGDYVSAAGTVALFGKQMVAARQKIAMVQARSLRHIDNQLRSFESVDWLSWLVPTGPVQLNWKIPELMV